MKQNKQERVRILNQIHEIQAFSCKTCPEILEIKKEYKFGYADDVCKLHCKLGVRLQELGAQLLVEPLEQQKSSKEKKPRKRSYTKIERQNIRDKYLNMRKADPNITDVKAADELGVQVGTLRKWKKDWNLRKGRI